MVHFFAGHFSLAGLRRGKIEGDRDFAEIFRPISETEDVSAVESLNFSPPLRRDGRIPSDPPVILQAGMADQPKIRADKLVAPCQGDIRMHACRSQIFGQADADGLLRHQDEFRRSINRTHMEHVLYPWMRNAVVSGKGYQLGAASGWQTAEPVSC
nr:MULTISPECIES: hypothetical protein [unclassified Agrobacterium]